MSAAEEIANGLAKGRRVGTDRYTACCPAHKDNSPSLTITQKSDRVLVYCHGGCRQSDVLDALVDLGLWNTKGEGGPKPEFTKDELEYFNVYCLTYRDNVRAGFTPTADESAKFRAASKVCYREGVTRGFR